MIGLKAKARNNSIIFIIAEEGNMRYPKAAIMVILLFVLAGFGISAAPEREVDNMNPQTDGFSANLQTMPLAFTQNKGQWPESILFRASVGGATVWFTDDGAYYRFTRRITRDNDSLETDPRRGMNGGRDSLETIMIKASLQGGNKSPRVSGSETMEYKCNYFLGNDPAKWLTDVPNYQSILMREIYSGIDLKYYGDGRQMEYDFIISPGADYTQINIRYEGAKSLSTNDRGELVVETKWGSIIERLPLVYQFINGEKKAIIGKYYLTSESTFSFKLDAEYNPEMAAVIDPVLTYSTFLGGGDSDAGYYIALDGSGCAYITGYTYSADFPTSNPYDNSYHGNNRADAFVTKLNAAGNALIYSTYFGGARTDYGNGIAVDGSGCAYISGYTYSPDFPTQSAFDNSYSDSSDAFVAKLSSAGNALIYSTYIGGIGIDGSSGIAVDGSGCAYITGWTSSNDFPLQNPFAGTNKGYEDVFITKLGAAGNTLIYSTYLGGSEEEEGLYIAIDGSGCAYVTGKTYSADFPTQNAYDNSFHGSCDIFVTKLSAAGYALAYSTFLGGNGWSEGDYIAVDGARCAYVTGNTTAADFPTQNAYDNSFNDSADVYVTKLSAAGNSLIYSTYLGGGGIEYAYGIAVDVGGCAYVAGNTSSLDFPTQSAYSHVLNGSQDAFVTKFSAAGNNLIYSTYIGGSGYDGCVGIAVDWKGNAYVVGGTQSTDFPCYHAVDSTFSGGSNDGIIIKLPNIISVSTLSSDGSGSLQAAIDSANAIPGTDIIVFSVSGTITLAEPLHALIDDSTEILGSTAPGGEHSVIIDGRSLSGGNGLVIQSRHNKIEGLTIINMPENGIAVTGPLSAYNTITHNLIYKCRGLAVDLNNDGVTLNDPGDADTGPNDLLNYPEIDSVFMNPDSSFNVNGHSPGKSTVEFFVSHPAGDSTEQADPSGHGQAYSYVRTVTANPDGSFTYTVPDIFKQYSVISTTATDTLGNTSEFSDNFTLTPGPLIIVGYSPINLKVIDPQGFYIGKDANGNLTQTLFPATYDENPNDSINVPHPIAGSYIIVVIRESSAPPGSIYSVGIRIDGSNECMENRNQPVPDPGTTDTLGYEVEEGYHYINGDASHNGTVNVLDVTFLINYLYKHGVAPDPLLAGDANCNGQINLLDITFLISYLYRHGPAPCKQ